MSKKGLSAIAKGIVEEVNHIFVQPAGSKDQKKFKDMALRDADKLAEVRAKEIENVRKYRSLSDEYNTHVDQKLAEIDSKMSRFRSYITSSSVAQWGSARKLIQEIDQDYSDLRHMIESRASVPAVQPSAMSEWEDELPMLGDEFPRPATLGEASTITQDAREAGQGDATQEASEEGGMFFERTKKDESALVLITQPVAPATEMSQTQDQEEFVDVEIEEEDPIGEPLNESLDFNNI